MARPGFLHIILWLTLNNLLGGLKVTDDSNFWFLRTLVDQLNLRRALAEPFKLTKRL